MSCYLTQSHLHSLVWKAAHIPVPWVRASAPPFWEETVPPVLPTSLYFIWGPFTVKCFWFWRLLLTWRTERGILVFSFDCFIFVVDSISYHSFRTQKRVLMMSRESWWAWRCFWGFDLKSLIESGLRPGVYEVTRSNRDLPRFQIVPAAAAVLTVEQLSLNVLYQ